MSRSGYDRGVLALTPLTTGEADEVAGFLGQVDLTLTGLGEPEVRLWVARDDRGAIVACTGFELSPDGTDALIRSVAVLPEHRAAGRGTELARFALDRAAEAGARRAWLFSRRSGPFWQRLGFEPADRDELARALAGTHQVRSFVQTGQLDREIAWSRPLAEAPAR